MAVTEVRGGQIKDTSIQRVDLDIATTGQAVTRRIIAGTNITIGSTGVDTGTGDVTINGNGDTILASAQTNSGLKTFLTGTFALRNVANTFNALFSNTNTADRTYTLSDRSGTLLDGTDLTNERTAVRTLTNARVSERVLVVTQAALPATNTNNGDVAQITGLAQAITSMTTNLTGTPNVGDMIMFQITDNGTARAITWGASFASASVALPTTTLVNTMLRAVFQRNNANTIWDCIATDTVSGSIDNNASYRLVSETSGSHTAAKVAGTYAMGTGDPLAVSGTGTLYPLTVIAIASADYPTINGITTKLRIRGQVFVNDVAPTGNFTFGLYPITRPATSGGVGLNIYTLGTVVTGSNGATVSAPAADSAGNLVGSDFAIPADGLYVIGVVTTATVAASSHLHLNAQLQMRNT